MLTDDIQGNAQGNGLRIGVGDGVSDDKPIVMDGHMTTAEEFNSLLDHIYTGCVKFQL